MDILMYLALFAFVAFLFYMSWSRSRNPRNATSYLFAQSPGADPLAEHRARLHQHINAQRDAGVPLAAIINDLDQQIQQANQTTEIVSPSMLHNNKMLTAGINGMDWLLYLGRQREELYAIMVQRNLNGREFEQQGDLPAAIALYEGNLADQFDGSHPYERLRIIYNRQKDYANALRVCRAYLVLPDRPNGQNKAHFREWADKLAAKVTP